MTDPPPLDPWAAPQHGGGGQPSPQPPAQPWPPAAPAWGPTAPPPQPPPGGGPVPPPWGPQWGPQWGQPVSTNPWSIVSLVTGVLPLFPVAIGAGITALVQIRRRRQSGTGLAVAGLVMGGLWMLGIAGILALGLGGAFDYREGPVSRIGVTTVGSCVRLPDEGPGVVTDCAASHDAEVYLVEELSSLDEYPDDRCYDAFEDYVGESFEWSDHTYGYYSPDDEEWAAGEHRVVRVIKPGFLEGPLRGSARKSDDSPGRTVEPTPATPTEET